MTYPDHSIQKSNLQSKSSLSTQNTAIDRLSTRLVSVVIIALTIFAFLPILLEPTFYNSMPRFIVSIVLGVLYGLVGTSKLLAHNTFKNRHLGIIIFFSAQISILTGLFWLGRGFNNNYWLLMLPVAAQGISIGWIGALGISLLELFIFWAVHWAGLPLINYSGGLFSILSAMVFTVLFTMIAFREQSARIETERLARDLQTANHRLAEYAEQVEELATIRERNRLARDIHDNLGHYLTVVNVQIEAARTVMDANPERAKDALIKAQKLTQDGLASVRKSVSALRESPLAERPLPEAITQLIEENQATGIATNLTINGTPRQLDPKIELTLYRTVQECLTNIRKHAHASHADVTLDYKSKEMIQLSVRDNGIGAEKTENGFGLLGLHERVQLLNGKLKIETEPGGGFGLIIHIPTGGENTT